MQTSASITRITDALLVAQKAIHAAAADSKNPHFNSRYADLASVIDAIKGPLNAAALVVIQAPTSCA